MLAILIFTFVIIAFIGYIWYGFNMYTNIWWAFGEQGRVKATLIFLMVVFAWPLVILWSLLK